MAFSYQNLSNFRNLIRFVNLHAVLHKSINVIFSHQQDAKIKYKGMRNKDGLVNTQKVNFRYRSGYLSHL